eukprot:9056960-Pyramimonas_sp.AAC.1
MLLLCAVLKRGKQWMHPLGTLMISWLVWGSEILVSSSGIVSSGISALPAAAMKPAAAAPEKAASSMVWRAWKVLRMPPSAPKCVAMNLARRSASMLPCLALAVASPSCAW